MSFSSRILALVSLAACLTFILYKMYSGHPGFSDGDSISHYLFSRFSFQYPRLFLDLWAKPVFTFMSAPFAQLGFRGIMVFNIICGGAAAWFAYLLARRLCIKNDWLTVPFLLFMPVYIYNLPSGLTEPLFSLVLILSIYLLVNGWAKWAAVIVSFLPFVRQEGFMLLPFFAVALLILRQYRTLPFLAVGTLLISYIGWFTFGDFFWVFTKNPYTATGPSPYGHGDLFHFANSYKTITGLVTGILFLLGILWGLRLLTRQQHRTRQDWVVELFLVYGCALMIPVAHSIFWWKGIFGSAGMTRVVAAVAPEIALVSLRGINIVLIPFRRIKYGSGIALILLLGGMIKVSLEKINDFYEMWPEQSMVVEACDWIKAHHLDHNKIYYTHPLTVLGLDLDPYDTEKAMEVRNAPRHTADIEKDGILIWDSGYGPGESQTPLDSIRKDSTLLLEKEFKGSPDAKGNAFRVLIFRKE